MFRSFGLDEKIAGNLSAEQRALSAAEPPSSSPSTGSRAGGGSPNTAPVGCSGVVAATAPQICGNPLAWGCGDPLAVGRQSRWASLTRQR